jgi:hypothetical protein
MDIKSENKGLFTYRNEISVPLNARRFLLCGEAFQHKIGMFVTGGKMKHVILSSNCLRMIHMAV